jgi:hypothetical protein
VKANTPIGEQKEAPAPAPRPAREIAPTIEESPGVITGPAGFSIVCARCSTANSEIVGARRLPDSEGGSFRVQYKCKTCNQVSPE